MFLVRLLYYVLDVVGWEINVLTVVVFFFFWHIEMYLNEQQVEEYSLKEEEIMNTWLE